jgi:hypothetical protein
MSLAVLSFKIANDESFLNRLAENFSQAIGEQGVQLSSVEKHSLREVIQDKKSIPFITSNVEPWAIG